MSDAPETPPLRLTMLSVSPDDFVRFIQAKAQSDDFCPVCKTDQWSVMCDPEDLPTYRLGTPIRNRAEQFYLSTFGYFCDNCGFIRQHMAAVVHKWATENPAPGQEVIDRVESNETDVDD
jgi:hypothetical protein